jgi:hypothetical protein
MHVTSIASKCNALAGREIMFVILPTMLKQVHMTSTFVAIWRVAFQFIFLSTLYAIEFKKSNQKKFGGRLKFHGNQHIGKDGDRNAAAKCFGCVQVVLIG